mgnify:CR=1 FL=1
MLIFLDSSIFCSDFHLTSTNFELLKNYICKGGSWLCFSEIVIDEVKNKYKEKISISCEKSIKNVDFYMRAVMNLLPEPYFHIHRFSFHRYTGFI